MALVLYKCDVCKREITIPRNIKGLEVIGRCKITLGCRGKLYQEELLEDFTRGTIPVDVAGLDNYQQRRVLFNHTQQQKKISWTIEHGLGTFPVVSTFIDSPTIDEPDRQIEVTPLDIVAIDEDAIRVTFDTLVSGRAQLVARATDPQLFNPVSTAIDTTDDYKQLTSSGELTFATTSTSDNLRVFVTYITPVGNSINVDFIVDGTPSFESPWVTSDRVLIQGKIYTTRSFNPITAAVASGQVPDNSRLLITGINTNVKTPVGEPIVDDQIFLLLADSPFAAPDRLFDQVVDAYKVSAASAQHNIVLSGYELMISERSIETIHPPIRSL